MTDFDRHTQEQITDAENAIAWHEERVRLYTDLKDQEQVDWHKHEISHWKQELRWLTTLVTR